MAPTVHTPYINEQSIAFPAVRGIFEPRQIGAPVRVRASLPDS